MKLFARVFQFYINSSIHVSLAVIALVGITVFEFDLKVPTALWFFVFFGSITGYNFVKYARIAGLHHRSLTNSLRSIQIFSFLSFAVFLYVAFMLSYKVWGVTLCFGLLTVFYAVPLLKNKNLRNLSGLKIFVVAVVWSGLTVWVPLVSVNSEIDLTQWITFVQRILFVVVLILPFEIRDLPYDKKELKTLPQKIGVNNTKWLGCVLLLVLLFLEFFKQPAAVAHLLSLLPTLLLTSGLLLFATSKRSRYYASFWVEGIPIFWYLVYLIVGKFFL